MQDQQVCAVVRDEVADGDCVLDIPSRQDGGSKLDSAVNGVLPIAGHSVQRTSQDYCIRVLTSDKLGAGTDAKVHIVLEDDTGHRVL